MCVIFWSIDHPGYDLVIASNRDEYLHRKTIPAAWHNFGDVNEPRLTLTTQPTDEHPIVSARDEQSGGTWLGMTRNGFFATLTNYTEEPPSPPEPGGWLSRGKLVRDWLSRAAELEQDLAGEEDDLERDRSFILEFMDDISSTLDSYPGFNLLVGACRPHRTSIGYTTNRTSGGDVITERRPDFFTAVNDRKKNSDTVAVTGDTLLPHQKPVSVRGLSNSVLRNPWSKVDQGVKLFNEAMSKHTDSVEVGGKFQERAAEEALIEELYDLLWTSSYPPPRSKSELCKSLLISPVQDESHNPPSWYATRTSTIILIRKATEDEGGEHRTATFVERDVYRLSEGEDGSEVVPERVCGGTCGRNCEERRFCWTLI